MISEQCTRKIDNRMKIINLYGFGGIEIYTIRTVHSLRIAGWKMLNFGFLLAK